MSNILGFTFLLIFLETAALAHLGISVYSEKLLSLLARSPPGRKSPVSPLQLLDGDKEPATLLSSGRGKRHLQNGLGGKVASQTEFFPLSI